MNDNELVQNPWTTQADESIVVPTSPTGVPVVNEPAPEPTAQRQVNPPEQPATTEPVKQELAPQRVQLDAESLQALRESARANQQSYQQPIAQPTQQQSLSPEEIDKLFNPYKIDKNVVKQMTGLSDDEIGDQHIQNFQQMVNGIVRQAVSTANVINEHKIRQLQESILPQIQPAAQFIQQQRQADVEKTFYGEYDGLEQYKPLVQQIARTTQFSPYKPDGTRKSDSEAMKEIAETVVRFGRQMNIPIDLKKSASQSSQPTQTSKSSVPRMASMQGGGRSTTASSAPSTLTGKAALNPWIQKAEAI